MDYVDKITVLRGDGKKNLLKIENNCGDIFYRISIEIYQDGKRTSYHTLEFTSALLAQSEFAAMTGKV